MSYGDTYYVGTSGKASPLILGVGFAWAAYVTHRTSRTLAAGRKARSGMGMRGAKDEKALGYLTFALAGAALLYGSGRARLIGGPVKVPQAEGERLSALSVPAPALPPGQVGPA